MSVDIHHRTTTRKVSLLTRIWRHRLGYLMLAPAFIAVLMFKYVPMGGLILAFKNFKFKETIWTSPWAGDGFTHFRTFFNNPTAWQLIGNTLIISMMKILLAFPFPILLAIMLNEVRSSKFKRVVQTVSYLPHFLAWTIVTALIERMFAPNNGLFNEMLAALGGDGSRFWMMEQSFFYPIMFISYVWKTIGWSSIIFLAAISGINPNLYEAAHIDGASKLKEVWHITLPGIVPVMTIIFILSLGDVLSAGYDQVYMLRTAGNMDVADILDTYIIRMGLEKGKYSYATAVGLIQSFAGLLLVTTSNFISKRVSETALW